MSRKLYHIVGAPILKILKMMIRQNIIQNFPFTAEDIEMAGNIFGHNVYTLKGRTTTKSPKVVVDDFIEIPKN